VRDTRRTRLLLSAALIVALALIAINYQNGSSPIIRGAKSVAGSVLGGAERAASVVTRPVVRLFGGGAAGAGGSAWATIARG